MRRGEVEQAAEASGGKVADSERARGGRDRAWELRQRRLVASAGGGEGRRGGQRHFQHQRRKVAVTGLSGAVPGTQAAAGQRADDDRDER